MQKGNDNPKKTLPVNLVQITSPLLILLEGWADAHVEPPEVGGLGGTRRVVERQLLIVGRPINLMVDF